MRMRTAEFTTEREWQPGHYGPSTVVVVKGHRLLTGCGLRDDIHVYIDADDNTIVYVLATNHALGYCGVEVWDISDDPYRVSEYFAEDWEVESILGPQSLNLQPINIAKRVAYHAAPMY